MSIKRVLMMAAVAAMVFGAKRPGELGFTKKMIDNGAAETAALVDVNGDGKLDIVSGENWYQAPDWKKHAFRELNFDNNYVDAFADMPVDVDGDGRMDIVTVAWFGKKVNWFRNPGKAGELWQETVIDQSGNVEFALLVDLDNDGKAREILPQYGGKVHTAWFGIENGKWVKHVVWDENLGHGIGAGDVNGDGRNDVLTPGGWLEAPADLKGGKWVLHRDFPLLKGSSFLHVMDVNGDGRNDVVSGNAHDYGVYWLEQMPGGAFVMRMIDDSWSQPHAITMVDLNRDGRMDFLTGKRYMAHNGKDPGEREPLGIYWYESYVEPSGKVQWVKHVVDYSTRTGGGMQLPVGDLNGDGKLDFVAPGKSGLFLFLGE
jgi:hypothetical protein